LPDADKVDIDEAKAIALMVANPSMIKRPVVEGSATLLVGFKESEWEPVLSPK
jgi:arsenate reductase-like glutaredoxin family protein